MKLSPTERQILINQYLILKKLDKNNDTGHYDANDYDNFITILHEGYEGLYDKVLYNLNYSIPEEIVREVRDILYMYDRAIISHEKLSEDEKQKISKHKITLAGFDGQNEAEHLAIYRFLIRDMKEWQYVLKSSDLDSHMPRLSKYRRQLKSFEQEKISGDILSFEGLKKVFE